jgi:hypothetical protein
MPSICLMSKSRLAPNQGVDFSWGLGAPRIKAASVGGLLFEDLILKGNAFRVVFLEPGFSSVRGGEDLDVLGIANLLACVDVDKTVIGLSSASVCPSGYLCDRD